MSKNPPRITGAQAMQALILQMMEHGASVSSATVVALSGKSPRYANEQLLALRRAGKTILVNRKGSYEYALAPNSAPGHPVPLKTRYGFDRDLARRRAEARNIKPQRDPLVSALFGEVRS